MPCNTSTGKERFVQMDLHRVALSCPTLAIYAQSVEQFGATELSAQHHHVQLHEPCVAAFSMNTQLSTQGLRFGQQAMHKMHSGTPQCV